MSGHLPEIFISHSHVDAPFCDALAAALRVRGFDVWYDNTHIRAGDLLSDEIQDALLARQVLIPVISEVSAQSLWVKLEIDGFRDLMTRDPQRLMIPVRIGHVAMPPLLSAIKYVNAANSMLDEVVEQIYEAVVKSSMPRQPKRVTLDFPIVPDSITNTFAPPFARYLDGIGKARAAGDHHDQRRAVFLAFLHEAFDIDTAADVTIEQYIQLQGKQVSVTGTARVRKGWIDAIFRDLIFEFKRDLKTERAEGLRELRDYLMAIPDGEQCVGLLTDGLTFIAYVLDAAVPDGLRRVSQIELATSAPAEAFLWFDAYLFKQNRQQPSSADIVRRFGLTSPTFVAASRILRDALARFATNEAGALAVKRQQWAFHLARVYGSADATNDEMFIRHTYLCQFAKILAYVAQSSADEAAQKIEGIIDGSAFEVMGINNIGEHDFFAWVLAPEASATVMPALAQIARSLVVYDLRRIDQDLLKQFYQNLVEPETRHELGEFYTPDWLADLTLEQIDYKRGQSLLDPACGSGTFLFTALRRLVAQGMTGAALVDFALDNVMGVDVHPLAVTIAKINYMLALLPHMQRSRRGSRAIPIAMANSLQLPEKVNSIDVITVPCDDGRFQIPAAAGRYPDEFTHVLEEMGKKAQQLAENDQLAVASFAKFALSQIPASVSSSVVNIEEIMWNDNVHRLASQIRNRRDSIWIFVLSNTTRPLFLQHKKFDVIAGNPPWLSYRYIQDKNYQADVKKLVVQYDLLEKGDSKLNTQIDLSTIFYEHAASAYLKPLGTIAFVMPRSVITGAKQHREFQKFGFTRLLDLKGVAPLFNVETCVLIRRGNDTHTAALPTTRYAGRLPAHECSLDVARGHLTEIAANTDFAHLDDIASPYYHPRFKQGATLVPRNLIFVTSAQPNLAPGQVANSPIMTTDPDVNDEAKVPWKGTFHTGYIDEEFLYATLLSKNLVPFGACKLHLVALPVITTDDRFVRMTPDAMRDTYRLTRSADDWFEPVNKLWERDRKSATMSLWERSNYQQGVVSQSAKTGYLVLYNAAGSNIASCVLDTTTLPPVNGAQPQGFILDHTAYWYRGSLEEAHFVSALLNAPCVDLAIKIYQTRGLFGARHIHRRPFEVCAIPEYDANNPDHQQLAALSQAAHVAVATLDLSAGGVVAARKQARTRAQPQIAAIDIIAQRLLGLTPAPTIIVAAEDDVDDGDVGDEELPE